MIWLFRRALIGRTCLSLSEVCEIQPLERFSKSRAVLGIPPSERQSAALNKPEQSLEQNRGLKPILTWSMSCVRQVLQKERWARDL